MCGRLPAAACASDRIGAGTRFGSLSEHEWAADPRSRGVVAALLSGIDPEAAVERLSGGERRRAALAALLLGPHDLLLLDEPTNHLDLEAISWLAGYLSDQAGAVRGGHARSVVPGRGDRADLGGRRRPGAFLRGRLFRLRACQGRARQASPRPPIKAPQPAPQGAGLAAAGAAGPDQQAQVPDRGGQRADRGRASAPGQRRAGPAGRGAPRQDRHRPRGRYRISWRPRAARPRDLAAGPGDRVGVVGVNGSGKTTLLRLLAGALR